MLSDYTVCVIPGGFTDTRLEAAYRAFQKGDVDYLVTAMKNGKEVGRRLLEKSVPERRLLVPPENYFPYASNLGDLTGAKTYLQEQNIFQKIGSTGITSEWWCAPRFLVTAWRLGYRKPRLIRVDDPRSLFFGKVYDIVEEWLTDVPAYLFLAMPAPDFYLRSIEPRLQKSRNALKSLISR